MDKAIAYEISLVPKFLITTIWPEIRHLLVESIEMSNGEADEDSVLNRASEGYTSIFIVTSGSDAICAFVLEQITFESGKRSLSIPFIGGEQLFMIGQQFMDYLINIAKTLDCEDIRGMSVRKGWMKHLSDYGWEPVHEVIKYKLGDKS